MINTPYYIKLEYFDDEERACAASMQGSEKICDDDYWRTTEVEHAPETIKATIRAMIEAADRFPIQGTFETANTHYRVSVNPL